MNEDNITFVKEINKTNTDLNKRQIGIKRLPENKFLINLSEAVDSDEIDLNRLNKLEYEEEIKNFIKNYTPQKPKSTELNAILTDDIPVNEHPRRFPLIEEKIIEEYKG